MYDNIINPIILYTNLKIVCVFKVAFCSQLCVVKWLSGISKKSGLKAQPVTDLTV